MKEFEKGIWYCSFWENCGYLLINPLVAVVTIDDIPPEPELLPDNWEDVLENFRSMHYAMAGTGSQKYMENWNLTHSPMRYGWPEAARGMVTIIDGNAVLRIPPEMKSAARKKCIRDVVNLLPDFGVKKVEYIVEPLFSGKESKPQEQILVDKTDCEEMICVCDHCRCTKTPHFFWYPRRGKPICLMLEKATLMDGDVNMGLRDRRHLQEYMTFAHWQKLINTWNDHNTTKISQMLHVPNYINLHTRRKEQCYGVLQRKGQVIAKIYHLSDDEDERPHFHYRRPNGTEVMISLTGAHYLKPVIEELTKSEKETLVQYLKSPMPGAYSNKSAYECLCNWWDQLHRTCFFKTGPEGDIFPMPDYMKLRIPQC